MKNQIIIHASGKQTRIALLENGELAQLFIESDENQRTVGNIYLAKVGDERNSRCIHRYGHA